MSQNDPDKKKDPWTGKKQPPDLEAALKRLQQRLKKTFFGASKQMSVKSPSMKQGGYFFVIMGAVIFFLWVLSGFFIVNAGEEAVVLRFGQYIKTIGPGTHWLPQMISTKMIKNVERISDYSYSANVLTKDESLISASVLVQYHIGSLKDYLFNLSNPEQSLQQAIATAVQDVMGSKTFDDIMADNLGSWANQVQETLVTMLDAYHSGLIIINVAAQPSRAPNEVKEAFDNVIKAKDDERRLKTQALAYEARVVPVAEGNAKRILKEAQAFARKITLHAQGDVAEFLALLDEYLLAPVVTSERMYLETMESVLSKSTKVIVDDKAGNVFHLPLDALLSQKTDLPKKRNNEAEQNASNKKTMSRVVADRSMTRRTYRTRREN